MSVCSIIGTIYACVFMYTYNAGFNGPERGDCQLWGSTRWDGGIKACQASHQESRSPDWADWLCYGWTAGRKEALPGCWHWSCWYLFFSIWSALHKICAILMICHPSHRKTFQLFRCAYHLSLPIHLKSVLSDGHNFMITFTQLWQAHTLFVQETSHSIKIQGQFWICYQLCSITVMFLFVTTFHHFLINVSSTYLSFFLVVWWCIAFYQGSKGQGFKCIFNGGFFCCRRRWRLGRCAWKVVQNCRLTKVRLRRSGNISQRASKSPWDCRGRFLKLRITFILEVLFWFIFKLILK